MESFTDAFILPNAIIERSVFPLPLLLVASTAFSAFEHEFDVVVVRDAVGPTGSMENRFSKAALSAIEGESVAYGSKSIQLINHRHDVRN